MNRMKAATFYTFWATVLIVCLSTMTSQAQGSEKSVLAISPAVTAGIGGGRLGATLDWSLITCRDSCGGFGLSAGMTDFFRREFSIGTGMIAMYMGSVLLHADLRFRDGKFAGAHVTPGAGIFNGFAIFRLGYDSLDDTAVVELGLTVKIPVWGWKK
jgi:hypothetical protein